MVFVVSMWLIVRSAFRVFFSWTLVQNTEGILAWRIISSCFGLVNKSVSVTREIGKPLSMSVQVFTMMTADPLWSGSHAVIMASSKMKQIIVSSVAASVRLLRKVSSFFAARTFCSSATKLTIIDRKFQGITRGDSRKTVDELGYRWIIVPRDVVWISGYTHPMMRTLVAIVG